MNLFKKFTVGIIMILSAIALIGCEEAMPSSTTSTPAPGPEKKPPVASPTVPGTPTPTKAVCALPDNVEFPYIFQGVWVFSNNEVDVNNVLNNGYNGVKDNVTLKIGKNSFSYDVENGNSTDFAFVVDDNDSFRYDDYNTRDMDSYKIKVYERMVGSLNSGQRYCYERLRKTYTFEYKEPNETLHYKVEERGRLVMSVILEKVE